jgi:hypothetical protein
MPCSALAEVVLTDVVRPQLEIGWSAGHQYFYAFASGIKPFISFTSVVAVTKSHFLYQTLGLPVTNDYR